MPTPESYQELSSAERRGARSSHTVELHLRGVALAECLPRALIQELSSAERHGARSSLTVELHPRGGTLNVFVVGAFCAVAPGPAAQFGLKKSAGLAFVEDSRPPQLSTR